MNACTAGRSTTLLPTPVPAPVSALVSALVPVLVPALVPALVPVLLLVLGLLCSGCNSPLYSDAGRAALKRGQNARALANLVAGRSKERHLRSRRENRRLDAEIGRAVRRLAAPALESAGRSIQAGDGARALEILLPLYGHKGLYRNLNGDALRDGRERLLPLLREAVSAASGVNLRALTTGTGAVASMTASVTAVRKRIEYHIKQPTRAPIMAMLGSTAQPVLKEGWRLVDGHLRARRFEVAMVVAERLAAILPKDQALQRRLHGARSQAVAFHEEEASKHAAQPGLQWAHHTLAARYGGSHTQARAIRERLRETSFRIKGFSGCAELKKRVVQQIQQGSGGLPIEVDVQLGRCNSINKSWKTSKRISWTEQRTRQVKVRENYTTTVYERKCKYVKVYANTTCTTKYIGNGQSRRTCRDNTNQMQRCKRVPRNVSRSRIVTKTQRYSVRLSLTRIIRWLDTGLSVSGRVVIRWPGGGTTQPFSYRARSKDYAFSDRAGSRRGKFVSLSSMQSQAVQRLAKRVHSIKTNALRPKATALMREAQVAQQAGNSVQAADYALQAWLVAGLQPSRFTKQFTAMLSIPETLARRPSNWATRTTKRPTRKRRRGSRRLPSKLEIGAGQAISSGEEVATGRLVSPRIPRADRSIRRLYRELRNTAWRERDPDHMSARIRVEGGPSHLLASRMQLSLRTEMYLLSGMRLRTGVELSALGMGTSGWDVGVDMGSFDDTDDAMGGIGLRYARHAMVRGRGLAASTLQSSNFDVSYSMRIGKDFGLWGRLALNALAWLGDDAFKHYHPQEVGLDYRMGSFELRAGAVWHVGGGGVRWKGGLGVVF